MIPRDKFELFTEKLTVAQIPFKENEPMSAHSTFKIGGPARVYVSPKGTDQLMSALMLAEQSGIRSYACGRGSNIVFPDGEFDGAVISTLAHDIIEVNGESIYAGAGVSLIELSVAAAKARLSGLEFAYGIPGSLGGAVFMNAGAYGGEMSGIVIKSRYIDKRKDSGNPVLGEICGNGHQFDYRDSVYRKHPDWVIESVEIKLETGIKSDIEAKMKDFMSRRREKQPLEFPSAGSAFKRYPGRYTAEMIDSIGLKGFSIGGAQVSEKHAGFIINKGGATAKDVRCLSDYIKNKIFEVYGIEIESEIIFLE